MSFIYVAVVIFTLNFLPTSQNLIAETDRLSLLAFRNKIIDPLGALGSWNESSDCSYWTGITCNRWYPSRVIGLDLQQYMSLAGTISPYIGNLTFLRNLTLNDNHFTGEIPQEINLTSCTELVIFSLANNELVGGVPAELGSISKLQQLHLSGNPLKGTIPVSLSNLSALSSLALGSNHLHDGNKFHGSLPDSIINLSRLSSLDVNDKMGRNQLTGSIPVSIGKLPNLIQVEIWDNQLSRKIPSSICNSTKLEEIDFGSNRLQGRIPPSMGNCSKLLKLVLWENQFTGTIPKQLIGLSSLSIKLDLAWNRLTVIYLQRSVIWKRLLSWTYHIMHYLEIFQALYRIVFV
ncbi:hypothetical protein MKX03_017579 [Papaver bracteatum]|nr:hypothetical protein MKX03_017579 [Papaver bracteatum]